MDIRKAREVKCYANCRPRKANQGVGGFLPPLIGEAMSRIREEALGLWETEPAIGLSFASTLAEGIRKTALLQSVYKKGKIQLVCFSFLLSGAISCEMLVKIDFYDERLFGDTIDTDTFWDYSALFPDLREEAEILGKKCRKQFIRFTEYDTEELYLGFYSASFSILMEILTEIFEKEGMQSPFLPIMDDSLTIMMGRYLEKGFKIVDYKKEETV